ncbi:MAG: ComEC/Rec2 family competence protein [Candidatus Cryptobacteroides sp.]
MGADVRFVRESLSFAAGTAAAAFFNVRTALFSGPLPASILFTVCAALTIAIIRLTSSPDKRKTADILLPILLFLCGVSVAATSYMVRNTCTSFSISAEAFTHRCAERLSAVIDSFHTESANTRQLIKALVTGDRTGLPQSVRQAFRDAGASHLLALSGLHLGIIYVMISKSLSILGKSPASDKIRSVATVLLCGFYTAVTGASPSLKRAFIFIALRESTKMSGREPEALCILNSALVIHLCLTPYEIMSPGFQLSYLAVAGILTATPRLKAAWQPEDALAGRIWDMASVSIGSQIFTAPAAFIHFGTFPTYFLITNIMAVPITGLLMPLAAIAILLQAIGICPDFLVRCIDFGAGLLIKTLETVSSLPNAAL